MWNPSSEFAELIRGDQWCVLVLGLGFIVMVSALWSAAERFSARKRRLPERQRTDDDDARSRDA